MSMLRLNLGLLQEQKEVFLTTEPSVPLKHFIDFASSRTLTHPGCRRKSTPPRLATPANGTQPYNSSLSWRDEIQEAKGGQAKSGEGSC